MIWKQKIYLVIGAFNDGRGTTNIILARAFRTPEEADEELVKIFNEFKDAELLCTMDSELNIEEGFATIYTDEDTCYVYEIQEIEI